MADTRQPVDPKRVEEINTEPCPKGNSRFITHQFERRIRPHPKKPGREQDAMLCAACGTVLYDWRMIPRRGVYDKPRHPPKQQQPRFSVDRRTDEIWVIHDRLRMMYEWVVFDEGRFVPWFVDYPHMHRMTPKQEEDMVAKCRRVMELGLT